MATYSYPTADWIAEQVGTHQWLHAPRLSAGLRAKGYTFAITPKRQRELQAKWEALHPTDAQCLARIQAELSGREWSPDTLDRIADHLRAAGLGIAEPT